ncbi:hypothetical protein MRB53_005303 [Persea americana]|uniref:Uncharacterized protein n=1 Tax=Persea americana TaxID=3435 RepID=A0ACC2MCX8_PERAE|nr:hypothetical protein MRB53_005303 [Persea americana]|eukprot:TRINITY_DN22177_c0_g1_i2.p1 TRINITY_DN22177_c0_g1~~TRINITY_DN22177_c0_g1_i2.p1  ORF type:complete len:583 (-),score=107.22 TRINITY_DN22177_c0_g1_i2:260-2008(-)
MAAQIFQNNHEISKQEVQTAIAKAVELRAIHAALLHGNSPANLKLPSSASPSILRTSDQFSAQEYPVFTPSYEDEPASGYHQTQSENRQFLKIWDGVGLVTGTEDDEAQLSDKRKVSPTWRKGLSLGLIGREQNICTVEDHKLNTACTNHISILQTSPATEVSKSGRRIGLGEFKTVATCNTSKAATINREKGTTNKNCKNSNATVPVTDLHSSPHSHQKNKGQIFSWLFPRSKKKPKAEMSPNKVESEGATQLLKELGIFSLESVKRQLIEANENRDAALMEAAEMKTSLEELKHKLLNLETYCNELKKSLKQAVQGKETQVFGRPNLSRRARSFDGGSDSSMPVSHEAMVEGFLQMVSEARLSVKQFCRTLISQIEETDHGLMERLNSILQPHNLTLHSRNSKAVLYHLESLINQSLHQDFENCIFQKNGAQKVLDPQQDHQAKFSAFAALRNLSWNEVLRKGTKYYSEDFSSFCDQKMSCIISTLNWSRQWPEQLLQSFFVAAKCIWLLHLLAFSFDPPLAILRVDENQSFDPIYMEEILLERPRLQDAARVKIMVTPGFYIEGKVLRCRVLCRHRTLA